MIDGNSLLFRAFFALPISITTKDGQVTNAVYGFISMLLKLLSEEKPDAIAVAFDRPEPTFRHKAYKEYKAQRDEIPAELPGQIDLIKSVLGVMSIPIFELAGFEADDILCALAHKAAGLDYRVTIVTGDKDALQLVSPNVHVMTTKKGITDTYTYDEERVKERYGIKPAQVPDFIGLKGDPSDNIPGVRGIGEKTAAKLLEEFGSLEEVYKHIDDISKPKLRQSLIDHEEEARLSKELAILRYDIPIEIDMKKLDFAITDKKPIIDVFNQLEFRSLVARLEQIGTKDLESETVDIVKEIVSFGAKEVPDRLRKAIIQQKTGLIVSDGEEPIAAIGLVDGTAFVGPLTETLGFYLESSDSPKIAHNVKELFKTVKSIGCELNGITFDTMVAAYLLDPGRKTYLIADLSSEFLGVFIDAEDEDEQVLAHKAVAITKIAKVISGQLIEKGLDDLFYDIELPLSYVLAQMEMVGIGVECKQLASIGDEISRSLVLLEDEIHSLAGEKFNINSPKQLGVILYERLGLPVPRKRTKTKTGYSTSFSVLIKLVDSHPIVDKVLAYRELNKIKTTYIDALLPLVDKKTNRLHTSFNQVGTATGRLASEKPNLQNIPIRGEWGARIRKAFTAGEPGWDLLTSDYSQIELRILAHMSEDDELLGAFERGEDVHGATAKVMLDISEEDLSAEHRRIAKAINFGLMYGMTAYGLAEQLNLTEEQAQGYIDRYFARYPGTRQFIDKIIEETLAVGYVRTMMGRIRYIPELRSSNVITRRLGERLAINTKIQGSAADIIKSAMVSLAKKIEDKKLKTRILLQIHDELILKVPEDEKQVAKDLVKVEMENVVKLRIPVEVNICFGLNWGDAHK